MKQAYICDYTRTPIGRYGGVLSSIRPDDLAAIPIRALMQRNAQIDWKAIDDVLLGCANQAGEDNRNVARMAALLAGVPVNVSAVTINRLCGSGLDAVLLASRAIQCGQADLLVAGGVESMSRAPFVMPKSGSAFSRSAEIFDTTMGWRFINPQMQARYGTDSMPETAENVARNFSISREDQDAFACRSQRRTAAAQRNGRLAMEITAVNVPQRRAEAILVEADEHPRNGTTLEQLSRLGAPFRKNGTVTAGNSSGINDGAAALILASEDACKRFSLEPIARVTVGVTVGLEPSIMGFGPAPAIKRLNQILGAGVADFDVIEINEAFASQALAVMRDLGLEDDAAQVNPNGGAIALGHPLGMSGTRIIGSAALELQHRKLKRGVAAMCIGVGQGIAVAIESP